MSDAAWDVFLYQKLTNTGVLVDLVGGIDNIYGPGRLEGPPDTKPFIVIRQEAEVPASIPSRSVSNWSVYAHDDPGDYMRIGDALRAVRAALAPDAQGLGQHPGGICRWAGDSANLSDEVNRTICRYGSYQFIGKDGPE